VPGIETSRLKPGFKRWEIILAGVIFLAGFVLRLRLAVITYLNPDEALQSFLAQGSWGDVLQNSLEVTHPPLLIAVAHAASLISRSDLALRLAPVLAGCLFPVILALWMWKVAGKVAALAVLFLLTLAPNLVAVSAQLRSYTLALLFLSASLLVLEEALDRGSWSLMAVYSLLLWLCILSDYSMAWFVGAAGAYCLLRLKGSASTVKAVWAAGQLGAASLYGFLFAIQVRAFRGSATEQGAVSSWLSGAFPKPGGMLAFPFVNTVKQFAYLMASVPAGVLALVLFAAALLWLWTGRTGLERSKARALAVLLVVPFLLNIAGAYALLFPYGRSRHTLVIGLFCACGVAILLQHLPRRAAIAVLWGALLLTPLWHAKADEDPQDISAYRSSKRMIFECLDHMRNVIPPGSLIFTERETLWVLARYESHQGVPLPPIRPGFTESKLGPWRVATQDYKYITHAGYETGLRDFRRHYGLSPDQPVWVLDGGWDVVSGAIDPEHPFTKAVRVFQAGSR
jgi:hypothetical protein